MRTLSATNSSGKDTKICQKKFKEFVNMCNKIQIQQINWVKLTNSKLSICFLKYGQIWSKFCNRALQNCSRLKKNQKSPLFCPNRVWVRIWSWSYSQNCKSSIQNSAKSFWVKFKPHTNWVTKSTLFNLNVLMCKK